MTACHLLCDKLLTGHHSSEGTSRARGPGNVTYPCDVWVGQDACALCVVGS